MEVVEEPPLTAELIRARHERLLGRLRAHAEANGHDPQRLRIVAVTKTWPVDVCRAALTAGVEMLGENRVREAEPKVAELPEAEWHLVGRLQSNKARRAVRLFSAIHSVDSVELLERLDRIGADEERRPRVLIQVNVSAEAAKGGFDERVLAEGSPGRARLTETIASLSGVDLVGLMTMAELGAPAEEARSTFRRLRALRDAVQQASGLALPELSMGMTADAEAAAAEGATLVRIGTALFGPRHDR